MDKDIARIKEQIATLFKSDNEIREWCRNIECENKNLDARIDGISELRADIKYMTRDYKRMEIKLDKLLELPHSNYNAIKTGIAMAIVGALVGYFFNQLV